MTDESNSAPSMMDYISDLSDQQDTVRIVLRLCFMSLSVIGSTAIVLKILRGFRSMTPYDRIVLGMSICDILASIKLATDEILVPRDTQWRWALGNEATCQASAAFDLSVGGALWYNAMLSLYFLLMVLSQVRQKEYVRKIELWIHLLGLWFPITTVTMGLPLGWYGVVLGILLHFSYVIKWLILLNWDHRGFGTRSKFEIANFSRNAFHEKFDEQTKQSLCLV